MSITRGFDPAWQGGGIFNPPPLHVQAYNDQAGWVPLRRVILRPTPPGPQMVHIPNPAPFGEDPTNKAHQLRPRIATIGMFGRLHQEAGQ